MRKLLIALSFALAFSAIAATSTRLNITKGKLHKGGFVQLKTSPLKYSSSDVNVHIRYEITKKGIIPKQFNKYLKGTYEQRIPAEFEYNAAYLDLQQNKTRHIREAKLTHLGRWHVGKYRSAHKILLEADNGKSEMLVYYHPKAPGIGWFKIVLKIKKIPVLGSYSLTAIE